VSVDYPAAEHVPGQTGTISNLDCVVSGTLLPA
jgi:hypothetical protein